jgi:uncharacterized secreted protein with C-terminal beta-propeller domain
MPVENASQFVDSLRGALEGAAYVVSSANLAVTLEDFGVPVAEFGLDSAAAAGGGGSFSETTLQEAGVDESDLIKYNGEHLYVVDMPNPQIYYALAGISLFEDAPEMPPASIRILRTDPDQAAVSDVGRIELNNDGASTVNGIYLSEASGQEELIAVSQSNPFVYWALFASDYYWQNGATTIEAFDVSDVDNVQSSWSLNIDGSLLASRRIDNTLYLVTRYSPVIEGVISYPQTEEEIAANQDIIAATGADELLPHAIVDGGQPKQLLDAEDCYVPNPDYEQLPVPPATGTLVTITSIDLAAPQNMTSTCLNAYTSGFYASRNALYLTANGSDMTTLIHKFALQDGAAEYRGTGSVPGYIGTRNPSFLMGEHDGDLRVVSSTWNDRFFPLPVLLVDAVEVADTPDEAEPEEDLGRHRLTVLRESSTETALEAVASLPNTDHPQHIGKPGEDIYSVRYLGDRGYIVTFQVIDPLYVLDLSNPEDPSIAGELEIPGYSTLLQPLGENLLLGVGQSVNAELPTVQGVKMEVFNVADINSPVSMGVIEIGKRGSSSPALDDHHALTLLETEDGFRAAIPVQRNEATTDWGGDPSDPWYWYGWSDTGLHMFDIDGASGALSAAGSMIVEQPSEDQNYSDVNLYRSRSVFHDEAVYFIHGAQVWSANWGGENLQGPQ